MECILLQPPEYDVFTAPLNRVDWAKIWREFAYLALKEGIDLED